MSRRTTKQSNSKNLNAEVQALLRKSKGKLTQNDLNQLTKKYSNRDLAQKIQNMFIQKYQKISKRANKFAQIIAAKYAASPMPYHLKLEKALKYKQQYNLSDDEFALFRRIFELELNGDGKDSVFKPRTNMAKVLGAPTSSWDANQEFNVTDKEYKHLQEVLKIEAESRHLHKNVFVQSMTYTDCDMKVTANSVFRPELKHKLTSHIHPVIVALFWPKFDSIETRFLHSNIAGLIKSRYEKKPIGSKSNYELLYDLRVDPNDIVCDDSSPMLDVCNRAKLQVALWNNVLNLRNGLVFSNSGVDLTNAVDMCRMNKNDTPDIMFGRHDATVLKRLVSAFSYRPTIVKSLPHATNTSYFSSYNVSVRPTINSISMINMRLPFDPANTPNLSVQKATHEQHQFFMLHNGKFESRRTQLFYSKEICMFYIDRRTTHIKLKDYKPFSLNNLPHAMIGLQKVSIHPIDYDETINIQQRQYNLKSVLCVNTTNKLTNNSKTTHVLGTSAIVNDGTTWVRYDPLSMHKATAGKVKIYAVFFSVLDKVSFIKKADK
jgi:hypothetical protein